MVLRGTAGYIVVIVFANRLTFASAPPFRLHRNHWFSKLTSLIKVSQPLGGLAKEENEGMDRKTDIERERMMEGKEWEYLCAFKSECDKFRGSTDKLLCWVKSTLSQCATAVLLDLRLLDATLCCAQFLFLVNFFFKEITLRHC